MSNKRRKTPRERFLTRGTYTVDNAHTGQTTCVYNPMIRQFIETFIQ